MNKRHIRFGVIGTGWVSQYHLQGIARCHQTELVAVCDADPESARIAADKYDAEYCLDEYKKLLDIDEIDAVDVILPTYLHREVVLEAVSRGKHVLCEKPMAASVSDCQQMIDAAKRHNVLLMPMHNRVFYGAHKKATELLSDNAVGQPVLFQANFLTDIALREGFLKQNWRSQKTKAGGGVVMEMGVHLIYTAESLLGRIDQVTALNVPSRDSSIDTEAAATIIGRFVNGCQCVLTVHHGSGILDDRQMIVGHDGAIVINAVEATDTLRQPVLGVYRRSNGDWHYPRIIPDWDASFGKLIDQFTSCVLNEQKPLVTTEDGLSAIAVVEAIYESARSGKCVTVPRKIIDHQ